MFIYHRLIEAALQQSDLDANRPLLKNIPVSSEFGYMIIDRGTSQHDYLECGKTTLITLECNLKSGKGRHVPRHNAKISFCCFLNQ